MSPAKKKRRVLRWTLLSILTVLTVAIVGTVAWSQIGVARPEAAPLAAVQADPAIEITDEAAAIVLTAADQASSPSADDSLGLVFIPGGKIDPWAYVATLSGLVTDSDMTVVITKPWLNLAFFDLRPLSAFTELAPEVDTWLVGGHSLGGVRACSLADDAEGLILFASYCATDLSGSGLPVLSIAGSEDGLSTPQKIADAAHLLPAETSFVEIAGAGHASFGAYGPQAGDGTPTITLDEMVAELTETVAGFARDLG